MTNNFSIPVDLYYDVFKHLASQASILFKCLQVNKTWAYHVMPILWSSPYELASDDDKDACYAKMIPTFLSCLNDEEYSTLTKFKKLIPSIEERKKPLFPYVSYLKYIPYGALIATLRMWFRFKTEGIVTRINMDKFINKILLAYFSMFTRECDLQSLSFYLQTLHKDIIDLTSYPLSKEFFLKLSSIHIICPQQKIYLFLVANNTDIISKKFSNLIKLLNTKPCLLSNIKNVEISLDEPRIDGIDTKFIRALINFIKEQNNLQEFILRNCHNSIGVIFASLQYQATNLVKLICDRCSFGNISFVGLINAKNLELISMNKTRGLTEDHVNSLSKSNCRIRFLCLYYNQGENISKVIAAFIKLAGENLNHLGTSTITNDSFTALTTYCPNLKRLQCEVSKLNYPILRDYLKTSSIIELFFHYNEYVCTPILPSLGEVIPSTVLLIRMTNAFSTKSLKSFVDNCKAPIEKWIIAGNNTLNHEHLKIILQFAKTKKSLRWIGTCHRSSWGFKEDKVFKELKNCGVLWTSGEVNSFL